MSNGARVDGTKWLDVLDLGPSKNLPILLESPALFHGGQGAVKRFMRKPQEGGKLFDCPRNFKHTGRPVAFGQQQVEKPLFSSFEAQPFDKGQQPFSKFAAL